MHRKSCSPRLIIMEGMGFYCILSKLSVPHHKCRADCAMRGIHVNGTIHNILSRTSKNMGAKLEIMVSMRAADLLHVDESMSLNGKKVWVWIFSIPIRETRCSRYEKAEATMSSARCLETAGKVRLYVTAGLRTRVTMWRCWAHLCARSERSCARILTVRRQMSASHLKRVQARDRCPRNVRIKQRTRKHLSPGAGCTNICAGAYAESSKSEPIARICKSFAPSLATRTRICSDSSWIRGFPQPTIRRTRAA